MRIDLRQIALSAAMVALGAWPTLAAGARLPVGLARGTQTDAGDESLRGVGAVAVWIEEVGAEARAMGVDEDWIRKRVSAALARDSVAILAARPVRVNDGTDWLIVRLQTTGSEGTRAVAWHLGLALHRRALLPAADSLQALVRVWEAPDVTGLSNPSRLVASIREALDGQLREFTRAWRAARAGPSASRRR